MARRLPQALFPDQPVQAQRRSELAEGRLGRLALAARRLACAVGWQCRRVAAKSSRGARALGAVAEVAAVVEHDAPVTARLAPPRRVEPGNLLAFRVEHRTGRVTE